MRRLELSSRLAYADKKGLMGDALPFSINFDDISASKSAQHHNLAKGLDIVVYGSIFGG